VASCLEQTYSQVEAIVIDDGSADDTPKVLRELEAKYGTERLRCVRQDNAGVAAARNRGMELARGEFLQFLDSDDMLDVTKFEVQVAALREDEQADVAVCDYHCVWDDDLETPFEVVRNDVDIHHKLAEFWLGVIWTSTPLIRRERLPAALRWNAKVVPQDDNDFMFRLFLGVGTWCYTPGVLCTWIHHEGDRLTTRGPVSKHHYWESIPRKNWWMVTRWAYAILNEQVRYSRNRRLLLRAAGLMVARPWNGRVFRLALGMGLKSCAPWWLLDRLAAWRKHRAATG
jgi:glycosyltransferase involved in cell wall biosynthesis